MSGCPWYFQFRDSLAPDRSGNGGTDAGAGLVAGAYSGTGQCRRLLMAGDEDAVLEEISVPFAVTINDAGLPATGEVELAAGQEYPVQLGDLLVARTVTAVTPVEELVSVNYDASVSIDPESPAPIELAGEAAETYTPQEDGGIAYALAMELRQEPGPTAPTPTTVAYDCHATLAR
ncbi:MAG: hypothetical protein HY763_00100 [Planctomycetes bacterium]|nr:hypothetical protein [Planctomycetota bacterium]